MTWELGTAAVPDIYIFNQKCLIYSRTQLEFYLHYNATEKFINMLMCRSCRIQIASHANQPLYNKQLLGRITFNFQLMKNITCV